MSTLPFFRGIRVLLFCMLVSCNTTEKKQGPDIGLQLKHNGYDERIENIFAYIKESKFNIPLINCNNIIILQTNLCNSCNKEKLTIVLDSLSKTIEPIYFILADNNSEIKKQIEKFDRSSGIFIDTLQLLAKHSLSFLRNIRISTCKGKIIKWYFI